MSGEAQTGMVLGIIGTVLLGLALAGIIVLIVLSITIDGFWDGTSEDGYTYDTIGRLLQSLSR
ncbi:hypothetical protein [Aeromicrobium sp.]|uniref:hypothetical protein n=1 Tax=Aeromicrobium sp. TaxID=1871063 RepID=UPI0030BFCC38